MRRIFIDKARRKAGLKRGGDLECVPLPDVEVAEGSSVDDLLALEEVLIEFEKVHPGKAKLVNLRYFAGLSEQQAADALGICRATAARHGAFARAWLFARMS